MIQIQRVRTIWKQRLSSIGLWKSEKLPWVNISLEEMEGNYIAMVVGFYASLILIVCQVDRNKVDHGIFN